MISQALAMNLHPVEKVLDGWVHAFGDYYPRRNAVAHQNSPWSKAVILAKRRHENIIGRFGDIIATHLTDILEPGSVYIITPVPCSPERDRYLFRSLDRSGTEILADCIWRRLAGKATVRMANLLVQQRAKAKSQHQCQSMAERAANVRNLYAVKPGTVFSGEGVILVDDIITSGATMAECARVLRATGAKDVLGVALARTVRLKAVDLFTGDLFEEGITRRQYDQEVQP